MKLSEWLDLKRGRGAALAEAVGVSPVLISQWAKGPRDTPFERCVPIEQATNGEVTRRDLRPADWGAMWPELISTVHPWPPMAGVIKADSARPMNIEPGPQEFAEIDLGALPVHACNDSLDAGAPAPARA
jgi:DNA-binding transcriptional regulator YdaS (Cro superfamily)